MEDSDGEVKTTASHTLGAMSLLEDETGSSDREEGNGMSDEERLPNIPEELRSNFFLGYRMRGKNRSMTGDVLALIVFVNDSESEWTSEDMDRIKQANSTAAIRQKEMAAEYGAELNLNLAYCESTVSEKIIDDLISFEADIMLEGAGLPEMDEICDYLKDEYDVDEAAVFFYLNKTGRASTVETDRADGEEFSFFYRKDGDFRHEMNHLFGAVDYYYPSEAETLAGEYWPDSIMLTGGDYMDPLSAYLVGWTDHVPENVISFLRDTAHITAEMAWDELKAEVYTGNVENYRGGNAYYTGYMEDGLMKGYGSVIYDDGSSYEGDWEYGLYHGFGTFRWADGSSYAGEWHEGVIQGDGTFYWNDGSYFVGEWYEGRMHGEGTIYYYNGTTQSGTWENGEYIG